MFEQVKFKDQQWGSHTYAQHFDDGMILNIFFLLGITKASYIDIGAHHPFIISNTALLYEKGWRGINIEANPALMTAFQFHRPEDKNINIGIGVKGGLHKFFRFDDFSGLNTFSEKEAYGLPNAQVRDTILLPVLTLDDIILQYCSNKWPELLNIDIEGLDYEVLESQDFSIDGPKVMVVETRPQESNKMKEMLKKKGYFCYCRMSMNLFFVREKYRDLLY